MKAPPSSDRVRTTRTPTSASASISARLLPPPGNANTSSTPASATARATASATEHSVEASVARAGATASADMERIMQAVLKNEKLVPEMGYLVDEQGAPILSAARPNRLKRLLASGKVAIGCLLAYDAPWLVEVLGMTGYDFVTIDLEHELIDDEAVTSLVRAADGVGLTTIVRMPASERLFPFLSAGRQAVQVPDLRDRAHAAQIVELTRFSPLGRRTYYTQTRAAQ